MEASAARREGAKEGEARTLAVGFCLVTGLALFAVGVLGLLFGGRDFSTGPGVSGANFIVFEVNGWHNVVHIATGTFLLLMAVSARTAIPGALIFGVVYVAVTVLGFIDGDDLVTIAPVNMADNYLHLALAAVAILIGAAAAALRGSARRGSAGT